MKILKKGNRDLKLAMHVRTSISYYRTLAKSMKTSKDQKVLKQVRIKEVWKKVRIKPSERLSLRHTLYHMAKNNSRNKI